MRRTAFYEGEAGGELSKLVAEFEENAEHLPAQTLPDFLDILLHALRRGPLGRARCASAAQDLGLLEARLVEADWIVLGGLNERVWPGQPDPGPWLNRPMRKDLEMQLPERQIGLTAHDFAQAFAGGARVPDLVEAYRRRAALPSRWVPRLKMLTRRRGGCSAAAAMEAWAEAIDEARARLRRCRNLPAAHRPAAPVQRDRVEKLIRDPYGIYARKVLRLQKMDPLRQGADAALRGEMIHDVLPASPSAIPLLSRRRPRRDAAIGREVFQPFMAEPDVAVLVAALRADRGMVLRL